MHCLSIRRVRGLRTSGDPVMDQQPQWWRVFWHKLKMALSRHRHPKNTRESTTLPPAMLPRARSSAEVIVVCPCGHEWQPTVHERCPECNLSPEHGAN